MSLALGSWLAGRLRYPGNQWVHSISKCYTGFAIQRTFQPKIQFSCVSLQRFSSSAEVDITELAKGIQSNKRCTVQQLELMSAHVLSAGLNVDKLIHTINCLRFATSVDEGVALAFISKCCARIEAIMSEEAGAGNFLRPGHVASVAISVKRFKTDSVELRAALRLINIGVLRCASSRHFMKEKNICKVIYGLQGLSDTIPEVKILLNSLIRTSFSVEREEVSASLLGMALYGLHAMPADSAEVRAVLTYLTPRIVRCSEDVSGQSAAMMLYGLRMMQSTVPEVRLLVSTLAAKIVASSARWSANDVTMAMLGLQNMSSAEEEVLDLMHAMTSKISDCIGKFNEQRIPMLFEGLKNMHSDSPVVCALLKELSPKLSEVVGKIGGEGISTILFGLRNMSTDVQEVRDVLAALLPVLEHFHSEMQSKSAAWALYSLKQKKSDCSIFLSLVAELNRIVNENNISFDGKTLAMAVYGLKYMSADNLTTQRLLTVVSSKIAPDCSLTCRQLSMVLFGLQCMSNEEPEVRSFLKRLLPLISASEGELTSQYVGMMLRGFSSMTSDEPIVLDVLLSLGKLIGNSGVCIETDALSNAVQGLKGMDLKLPEVKEVLAALSTTEEELTSIINPVSDVPDR